MKYLIVEYGDLLIGIAIFIVIIVGIAGHSYKSEIIKNNKNEVKQLHTICP